MPAIILIPFVFLFGANFQTLFSIFLGSINVVLVYLLCKRLNFSSKTSLLTTIFFGFGTNHWYLTNNGWAWFLAHIVALFFLLLSLIETLGRRRLLLIGFLLGASFWSRSPIIFTLPFFYIFLYKQFYPWNKNTIKNLLLFNLGIIFFVSLDGIYNLVRFGNLSILGPYQLIPNIDKDPMFKDGLVSINFIGRHLEAIFFHLPTWQSSFPYLIPSLYSMAFWFTSPAILLIFKAKNSLLTKASWVAIIPTLLVIMLWAGVGYSQFGYRFIQDVMPFLLILVGSGVEQTPQVLSSGLIFLSILVNLWGVIMINLLKIWVI